MKINRQALLKALQAVKPGLARSLVIEQSTCFVFIDGVVCTFNDEISVSYPIEVDFEGAVPAKEFFDMISKIKKDEIELTVKDGELLLVGGTAKAGLRLDEEIELPIHELGLPEEDEWVTLPDMFCEAVKFCLFSVCKDTKMVISNIFVNGADVISTDNNRITWYDLGEAGEKAFEDQVLLIPANAARSIVEYAPIEYAETDGWIHFRNEDDAMFSCRVTEDDYPDFKKFLNVKGSTIEFPENTIDILDRASAMCQDKRINILLEKNKITIEAEGVNGWFREPTRIAYTGADLDFDIQPEFMKAMIKNNRKAVIGQSLKFEGENYVHVVNLMEPRSK